MSRQRGPGLFFQSQNMEIHNDGFAVKKMNDSVSKASQKKVGGNRKALQDLSNSGLVFQTQKLDKEGTQKKPLHSLSKPGLFSQTQNLDIHKEGSSFKKISDGISKASQKKAGTSRKALQDLSNSLTIRQDAGTKKESLSRVHRNVAEERLHSTKHCTEVRKAEMDQSVYDEVLLEHGLLPPDTSFHSKEAEVTSGSPQRYLELESIPEMPISATKDWFSSPGLLDTPAPSSFDLPKLKMSILKERELEQDQKSNIHAAGLTVKKASDAMSKASQKKVGEVVPGNRKALLDISNLSSRQTVSAKKLIGELQNVKEEGFLHDHNKCVASLKTQIDHDRFNDLLFEHGLQSFEAPPEKNEPVVAFGSPPKYLELDNVPELMMPALTDWSCSPVALDSPPFSPSKHEVPELKMNACFVD